MVSGSPVSNRCKSAEGDKCVLDANLFPIAHRPMQAGPVLVGRRSACLIGGASMNSEFF